MSDDALRRLRPRVVATAWRVARRLPPSVDLDELVQVGMIGAWQALQTYRPDAGASVETWVERRARGAMIDEMRRRDPLSKGERLAARARAQATERLAHRFGRPPRRAELAAELGWSDEQLRATDTISHAVSWEEFCDMTHDPSKAPLAALLARERADRLERAIEFLPPRSREVLRHLLDGDLTHREIGALFGLSEQRVGQIVAAAVDTLAALVADTPPPLAAPPAPAGRVGAGSGALYG